MGEPIKITPLQDFLLRRVVPIDQVKQVARRSRIQVWRWATGRDHPKQDIVPALIGLYAAHGHALDYNGCYVRSIEISADQARTYGLTGGD